MKPIKFAYDGEVGKRFTWQWHHNCYDDKYYPTNGLWEFCYYDYHAPLQTVCEANGVKTEAITVSQAMVGSDHFFYVLTFRYLLKCVKHEYNVFDHLPIGLIRAINCGQCTLILNDGHESGYYDQTFFENLEDKLYRINTDNVLLISGNIVNSEHKSKVKIITWQYFETASRLTAEQYPVDISNKFNNRDIFKKFLCLNRINREIRFYFMYRIYQACIKDFRASLNNIDSVEDIISYNGNIFIDKIKDDPQFKKMLSELPWTVDVDTFGVNHWNTINTEFSYDNGIFISTETLFSSDSKNLFLTEKTFKPILLKMPFIILGNPYILKRLHSIGYKTFDGLINEEYDSIFDAEERMEKIIGEVTRIANGYTDSGLMEIILDNSSILEHNHSNLLERRPEHSIIQYIKEYS